MHDIYDNNKVIILIAGYESVAMIDTGSTLSTISRVLYERISRYTGLTICKDHSKRCSLADGSEIVLDECVNVPLKINKVSLEARLFILDIEHINVIIGCDLLNAMNARIDFGSHRLITIGNKIRTADVKTLGLLREINKPDRTDTITSVHSQFIGPYSSKKILLKSHTNCKINVRNTLVTSRDLISVRLLHNQNKHKHSIMSIVTNESNSPLLITKDEEVASICPANSIGIQQNN